MARITASPGDDITSLLDGDHTGDHIVLPPGEYYRSGPVDMDLDGTTIEGDGGQAIINHPSGHSLGVEWNCYGDSVVRNITFAGQRGYGGSGQQHASQVLNGGADLTFENVRWPDGSVDGDAHAMYVRGDHSGTMYFRRCLIQGFADNGLYASAMGAYGGPIRVEDSVFRNNNIASVRLGGSGSYVIRSLFEVDNASTPDKDGAENARGVWIHESGDYLIENNDFIFDTYSGNPINLRYSDAQGATAEIINNRIRQDGSAAAINNERNHVSVSGSGNHLTGSGNLSTPGVPSGVVACSGSHCDPPGDGGEDWSGHTFTVICTTEGVELDYSLTVTEGVRKIRDGSDHGAEGNDTIIDNGNGTYTVDGFTGNAGFGDTYEVRGEVTAIRLNNPDNAEHIRVMRDGDDVTSEYFDLGDGPPEQPEPDPNRAGLAVLGIGLAGAYAYQRYQR